MGPDESGFLQQLDTPDHRSGVHVTLLFRHPGLDPGSILIG
jgi:uncharacterized membrane protein